MDDWIETDCCIHRRRGQRNRPQCAECCCHERRRRFVHRRLQPGRSHRGAHHDRHCSLRPQYRDGATPASNFAGCSMSWETCTSETREWTVTTQPAVHLVSWWSCPTTLRPLNWRSVAHRSSFPQALAINSINGNLVIGDGGDGTSGGQIVQVTPAGTASVLSVTNPATPSDPTGLSFDAAGNLYILDGSLNTITELYTNKTSALLALLILRLSLIPARWRVPRAHRVLWSRTSVAVPPTTWFISMATVCRLPLGARRTIPLVPPKPRP